MTTLKSILDSVMGESGFLIPTAYANGTNPDDKQLLHLANAASDDIRELGLSGARRFWTFHLDDVSGSYALPPDFLAYVPDTAYVGTQKVDIPVTPQAWADPFNGGFPQWRARFLDVIQATTGSGETFSFEYISSMPWESDGNAAKSAATADTDRWLLDDRLLILSIKWRWKKEKGVEDWRDDYQLFNRYVGQVRGRDGGSQGIYFGESAIDPSPYTPTYV